MIFGCCFAENMRFWFLALKEYYEKKLVLHDSFNKEAILEKGR